MLVALELGTTPAVVASVESRPPNFGERVLGALSGALPELSQPAPQPADDLEAGIRREVERLIHAAAEIGNAVVFGRFGAGILGSRPDVLRVFIHAPLEWRIAHVRESLNMDAARAKIEITRIDDARRGYAWDAYRLAWDDAHSYDLAIDSSRFDVAGAAATIAAAVHAAQASA